MAKFRARARTLDMLGKQQIAGIPNALHELFKNAYDAYADNVSVDYYRRPNILLIRDDGVGMSRHDFETRWLTLGTESKVVQSETPQPPKRLDKGERPTMGEKGIGRLAIATIGKIVLVVTKPETVTNDGELTVCLIHWGLFEIPGIDLDAIEIPTRTVSELTDLTSDLVKEMKKELVNSASNLSTSPSVVSHTAKIVSDFDEWSLPIERLQSLGYGPDLSKLNSGTHFIVHPAAEELIVDIDTRDQRSSTTEEASTLEKMLLGFSNSLTSTEEPVLSANFRDHLPDGQVIDRISEQEFFTKEEFGLADHKVTGEFDKFGNFYGKISVYKGEEKDIVVPFSTSGELRDCGPFKLSFAYLQGAKKDSLLADQLWEPLKNKLNKIGGIYVYMNGIRVLPYGNSDVDFLEIERRRTLQAAYYYFSYRRMFGAIDITTSHNGKLKEKAGREGFQSNKAYRQFREQLMNFFVELAARHFREDGAYAEDFILQRDTLQREHKLAQTRSKNSKEKQRKLTIELENYFSMVDGLDHQKHFSSLVEYAQERVSTLVEHEDLDDAAEAILKIEQDLLVSLQESLEQFKVGRPSGVGFTKTLAKQWEQYQRSYDQNILPHYQRAKDSAAETIGKIASDAKVHLDTRQRLMSSLYAAEEFSKKTFNEKSRNAEVALKSTTDYVKEQLRKSKITLQSTKDELELSLAEFPFSSASEATIRAFQTEIETRLVGARREFEDHLSVISTQLNKIHELDADGFIQSDESVAALETELEVLRDDYSQAMDLAQLGMAVSIVQHEFEGNVRGVRRSLVSMKRWADKNEGLREIYDDIRNGFDHLDNYLSLFTPMDRRMRRRKTQVNGRHIAEFIEDLFRERFKRHDVEFTITKAAAEHYLESFASLVLPVFVNLVDNSIHWLSKKDGSRKITIGARGDSFTISDNGPGISALDRDLIFEFGYSKKFGGRGMGLYIAKTSLNKDQLDINLINELQAGAHFIIGPLEAKN